jgi:hypothetical protein
MPAVTLTATPNPLVFTGYAGSYSAISYDTTPASKTDDEVFIQEGWIDTIPPVAGGQQLKYPQPVDLEARIKEFNQKHNGRAFVNDDWRQRGTFEAPPYGFQPGWIYQATAWLKSAFPHDEQDTVILQTMMQRYTMKMIEDSPVQPGGTFAGVTVTASRPVMLVAEMGVGHPITTSHGVKTFARPAAKATSRSFSKLHHLELKGDLRAGNNYTLLLRASEMYDGFYDEVEVPVTLLKRYVEIRFDKFRVVNDSDPGGSAEDPFVQVGVYESSSLEALTQEDRRYGLPSGGRWYDRTGWPELSDGDERDLPWRVRLGQLGAEVVTDDTVTVCVGARAGERDSGGPIVVDDEWGSGFHRLRLPEGVNETVTSEPFEVVLYPDEGDFESIVDGTYSVNYLV